MLFFHSSEFYIPFVRPLAKLIPTVFGNARKTLDAYAQLEKKDIRDNHSLFMNKMISKEIMKRAKLRNKCLKNE